MGSETQFFLVRLLRLSLAVRPGSQNACPGFLAFHGAGNGRLKQSSGAFPLQYLQMIKTGPEAPGAVQRDKF